MLEKFRKKMASALSPAELSETKAPRRRRPLDSDDTSLPYTELRSINTMHPRLGTAELSDAYARMPWLHAVTHKIAQAVGCTQWKLLSVRNRNDADGRALKMKSFGRLRTAEQRQRFIQKRNTVYDFEEIDDNPLLDLLHHGNTFFLGQTVLHVTQLYMDLVGEAFWLLEFDAFNVPINIWPLAPHWIEDFPHADYPFYIVQFPSGRRLEVPRERIIAFIDPNPFNPYNRGVGTARALADELETDEYAAKHLRNYFINRARPDMIISADGLQREDTKRLEERWLQYHGGPHNTRKPHFFNRKVDIKEIGQNFEEMQLVNLRKQERDTVLQVFGVSPEKFGVLSASNRSTIAAADLFWTKDVLMPRIETIRNVLQDKLVPLFDERLVLDFESPVVEDAELQLDVMEKAPWAFTKNEWREMAMHDSLGEEGEVFMLRPGEERDDGDDQSETSTDDEGNQEASIEGINMKAIEEKVLSDLQARLKDKYLRRK